MALNSAKRENIRYRREWIAKLRLRGLTQREIALRLAMEGVVDTSGRPFSLGTINSDLQALAREWRAQAAADTATLKGQALAELREVRRVAWERDLFQLVLRALVEEIKLLGLQVRPLHIEGSAMSGLSQDEEDAGSLSDQISAAMAHASDAERAALAEKMDLLLAEVTALLAGAQATKNKKR